MRFAPFALCLMLAAAPALAETISVTEVGTHIGRTVTVEGVVSGVYWSCSGGKWIAVGNPHHAMPSKTCGFQLVIPRTQLACEQSGGRWGPAGLFPRPICKMPTHDGGHVCADAGECEALCLTALTPAQRDLLRNGQKLKLLGKCAPVAPLFGCLAIVKQGYVTGLECRD